MDEGTATERITEYISKWAEKTFTELGHLGMPLTQQLRDIEMAALKEKMAQLADIGVINYVEDSTYELAVHCECCGKTQKGIFKLRDTTTEDDMKRGICKFVLDSIGPLPFHSVTSESGQVYLFCAECAPEVMIMTIEENVRPR